MLPLVSSASWSLRDHMGMTKARESKLPWYTNEQQHLPKSPLIRSSNMGEWFDGCLTSAYRNNLDYQSDRLLSAPSGALLLYL